MGGRQPMGKNIQLKFWQTEGSGRFRQLWIDLIQSVVLWVFGGAIYFLAEVLWKFRAGNPERISWTMLVLAAIICIPIDLVNEHLTWDMPLLLQAVMGGLGITVVELVVGLVLNVWLELDIWDYSHLPMSLWGQIALPFSGLWVVAAGGGIVLFDWLRHWLYGERRPKYRLL